MPWDEPEIQTQRRGYKSLRNRMQARRRGGFCFAVLRARRARTEAPSRLRLISGSNLIQQNNLPTWHTHPPGEWHARDLIGHLRRNTDTTSPNASIAGSMHHPRVSRHRPARHRRHHSGRCHHGCSFSDPAQGLLPLPLAPFLQPARPLEKWAPPAPHPPPPRRPAQPGGGAPGGGPGGGAPAAATGSTPA